MLAGLGEQALLTGPMIAFFASRQCPGTAIRAAMDWVLLQAQTRQVVIGGFHSPLEQSVLQVLLQARSPVVLVLARPIVGAKLNADWLSAIAGGHMTVVSAGTTAQRLTSELAAQRNELVVKLATSVVIAHASPNGGLTAQCKVWTANKTLRFL